MKYKATKKFQELSINPNHQNLDRPDFLALRRGEEVECEPPEWLVKEGFLSKVEKKEVKHGNSK